MDITIHASFLPHNDPDASLASAMKERAQELKAAARRGPRAGKADGESAVLTKIPEMPEPDRARAERLHAIIKASARALSPRAWYGMPAYAKDVNVCFQSAQKFKTRYATFDFSDKANLDEGAMWPTSFALKELTAADEARIGALVKKALPDPAAGSDEVRVDVELANITFVDTQIRAGRPPHTAMSAPLPAVLGNGVGVVVAAAGQGVDAAQVGRRVITSLRAPVATPSAQSRPPTR